MAEFDNYRKRSEKEKLNIYGKAVADTIEKILPIIDNLERALNSIDDKNSNYYKGIDLVLKQFFLYSLNSESNLLKLILVTILIMISIMLLHISMMKIMVKIKSSMSSKKVIPIKIKLSAIVKFG